MMKMGGTKMMMASMALLNFALYVVRAIIAGIMQNDNFENIIVRDQNTVTPVLVSTTLIVCMLGFASTKVGFMHMTEWSHSSRSTSLGVGMIAFALELLVMGYGIKQWNLGDGPFGELGGRAHFLSVAAVIQVVLKFLYVSMVHTSTPGMEMEENITDQDAAEAEDGKMDAEETAPAETA